MPPLPLGDGTWECATCGRRFTPSRATPQAHGITASNAASHAAACTGPVGPRGRRPNVPADVVARIVAERNAGRSLPVIAAGLNDDDVPTAQGGARWYPSTVLAVLRRTGPDK